jgi:hypothetical protein
VASAEELVARFAPNFYFGCEADDPQVATAFDRRLVPGGGKLKAMFTSDISHWDVVGMEGVLEEAYELVEHGRLDLAEFCDFTFGHIAELHAGTNPAFFDGTVVAEEVHKAARGSAARRGSRSDVALPRRRRAKILGVFGAHRPLGIAAPGHDARRHVVAVAHAEEQGALRTVGVFVQLAAGMDDERSRPDLDGLGRRPHRAAALDAEIDLGGVGMTVIGAGLSRLPARDRHISLRDLAEDLLDMLLGIEALLALEIEGVHGLISASAAARAP